MEVYLFNNTSEPNTIGKTLTAYSTAVVNGDMQSGQSLTDPEIYIELETVPNLNYCRIPATGRNYFVRTITWVSGDTYRLSLHVDVLETYKTIIKNLTCIIGRAENLHNPMIADPEIAIEAGQTVSVEDLTPTSPFTPGVFLTGRCYVLQTINGEETV